MREGKLGDELLLGNESVVRGMAKVRVNEIQPKRVLEAGQLMSVSLSAGVAIGRHERFHGCEAVVCVGQAGVADDVTDAHFGLALIEGIKKGAAFA